MHNLPHTIARIPARTHQIRPGSWADSTELASNRIRSASQWQHTVATHERPKSGSSPKHETPACGAPPLAQIMSTLQYAIISPSCRAARQPAHPARDLCTFAAADRRRRSRQPPRDLITPANAKRQVGGRRGSGSNLHRNGLSKCTSSQQAACRRVEDGPHLEVDAIRGIKEQLQADRQQVRQSLLAATPHMDIARV
jgi:hypothetical protein